MNRLNPIYILALVVTFFIITFVSLNNKKDEFKNIELEYNEVRIKAKDFNDYKKTWFDKRKVLRKIDSIVKSSTFRKEKILKTQNSNIVKLKIESSNPRVLNKFLNRVLNEKLIIKKLDVKEESIFMEIGFK